MRRPPLLDALLVLALAAWAVVEALLLAGAREAAEALWEGIPVALVWTLERD